MLQKYAPVPGRSYSASYGGEHKFAFHRVLPDGTGAHIYDIQGLLSEMKKKEGRKPLPSSDLVLEFESLIAKTSDESTARSFRTTLFDDNESAANFVSRVYFGGRVEALQNSVR